MDTLSDVNFGEEDSSIFMVSAIAGATVVGLFAGWIVKTFCINKALTARLGVIEGKLGITPVTAPAKA